MCQAPVSQSLLHSDHFTGDDTATKRFSDSQSLSTAGGAGVLLCGEHSAAGEAGRHCTRTSLVSRHTRPGKSWLSDAGSLPQARPSTTPGTEWARHKQSKRRRVSSAVSSRVGRHGISMASSPGVCPAPASLRKRAARSLPGASGHWRALPARGSCRPSDRCGGMSGYISYQGNWVLTVNTCSLYC